MKELKLNEWFLGRPKWLQAVASNLLSSTIGKVDIDQLVTACKNEVGGQEVKTGEVLIESLFGTDNNTQLIKLKAISNLKGINALSIKSPLNLGGSELSIVYGLNGSGKSGYTRVLKHAFGAKSIGTLLGNVFSDESCSQECTFEVELSGENKSFSWSPTCGVFQELNGIEIFDSSCGSVYVTEENEVVVEPRILKFFTVLVEVCDQVAACLQAEFHKKVLKKPEMPEALKSNSFGIWYENLIFTVADEEVERKCLWSEKDETKLQSLNSRLRELDPLSKQREYDRKKQHLDSFIQEIKDLKDRFSDERCQRAISARCKSKVKKEAAENYAAEIFEKQPLNGVGSDVWKSLWNLAKKYSEEFAYTREPFPFVEGDARCVLCQQLISNEGKDRLTSFEKYVSEGLEKEYQEARSQYQAAIDILGIIQPFSRLPSIFAASGIEDDGIKNEVIEFYQTLGKRKEAVSENKDNGELVSLTALSILEKLEKRSSEYKRQVKEFEDDAKENARGKLKGESKVFEARKWLSENKSAIKLEILRLKELRDLKEALKLTNTLALSKKKSELSELLVTQAFIERFEKELKVLLACRINVELLKSRTEKGRTFYKLQLKGCQNVALGEILSEGEYRIIALASFFADVGGQEGSNPLIFDDPVSSLDQDYEEAVAKKLISLSKTRQVIVFTHRLSLLGLLQDYGKKDGITPEISSIRRESWGLGEPGETPIFAKKPGSALNCLLNERLSKAEKVYDSEGVSQYELIAKGICSDFRILLERIVEADLLAGVVQRFSRAVNTLGKIEKLANITKQDCQTIEELMTKYSIYEHSQPNEAPVPLPLPEELKMDLKSLISWREDFVSRSKSG